mgnify:CR=1 FL=1
MILQASHLNSTLLQQNQSSDQQSGSGFGTLFGSSAKNSSSTASPQLTISSSALTKSYSAINDKVDAFGDIMGSYLNGFTDKSGEEKDSSGLVSSLEDTVRWIEEQYGEDAATAAMGMVVQSASSGQSEQAIGDGLLNTLKMIDRNYGINAGNSAIEQFNNGVNKELNSFFDNGSEEVFHAVTTSQASDGSSSVTSRVLTQTATAEVTDDEETINPTEELLAALEKDLAEQSGLQSLSQQLDAETSPEELSTADVTSAVMSKALSAYGATEAPQAQLLSAVA